jgi:omega-6 fatty acid desaturase (delta-12 desaturase)
LTEPKDWIPLIKPYAKPNTWRSLRQVADTLLPLLGLFYLAHLSLNYSLLLTLALDFAAALFLVRLFILQHDAGHGSFFPKKWMNDLLGFFTGVLTLVPYHHWQLSHARHHATSGNLDKRGVGDIYTMTLQEYLEATPWQRFAYRVYRNPFVMFFLGPIYVFMLSYRPPLGYGSEKPSVRNSVALTNLFLVLLLVGIYLAFGLKTLLLVYLPIQYFAGMVGIFLFYVQHQFEDAYWEHDPRWEYLKAAMEGSTYLKLPKVLQWLTGNIGFHHIHPPPGPQDPQLPPAQGAGGGGPGEGGPHRDPEGRFQDRLRRHAPPRRGVQEARGLQGGRQAPKGEKTPQWRKCRTPVKTMARPSSSAA